MLIFTKKSDTGKAAEDPQVSLSNNTSRTHARRGAGTRFQANAATYQGPWAPLCSELRKGLTALALSPPEGAPEVKSTSLSKKLGSK